MTYDPFSYGQIKLGTRAAAPAETPEDLLFEGAAPASSAFAPAEDDADWSALDPDIDSLRPTASSIEQASDFGADILGETMPIAAPRPAPVAAAPTPVGTAAPAMERPGPQPRLGPRPDARSTATVGAKPKTSVKAGTSRQRRPAPRSFRWGGTLVPSVVAACGGSASAWFYLMDKNIVMAGMVAATSLVGAALARVMFR